MTSTGRSSEVLSQFRKFLAQWVERFPSANDADSRQLNNVVFT